MVVQKSFGQIQLPNDPGGVLQAGTKQYIDTGDSGKANTSHTHAESDVTSLTTDLAAKAPLASPTFTGLVTAVRVVKTPQTVTYAATVTLDASTGDAFKITATGALALAVPTNPTDGQMVMVEVLASGGARVVTLNASIVLTTGLVAAPSIASGKVGYFGLRYSVLAGNVWVCLSQTQSL